MGGSQSTSAYKCESSDNIGTTYYSRKDRSADFKWTSTSTGNEFRTIVTCTRMY